MITDILSHYLIVVLWLLWFIYTEKLDFKERIVHFTCLYIAYCYLCTIMVKGSSTEADGFKKSIDMETNRIQALFDKYRDNYRLSCKPATENQLQGFRKNCMDYGIPAEIMDELVAYYKLNNNFFEYFECDDLAIFEWYEEGCLWLGQRDLWTFRYLLNKHKYAIGDASEDSFGEAYEFDTIEEMLQAFLSGDKI